MNWVGGSRSRVRQNAEKKIQKDFFERKRLVNKVRRVRPPLSKVKAGISQDLLFLQATASSTKSKPVRKSPSHIPKPLSLEPGRGVGGVGGKAKKGGGGLTAINQPPRRDLQLPMSPISHASNLEFMDTTTMLSETFEREGREGERGGEKDVPRVSTQKIPHRTVLESFGPPKIEDTSFGNLWESGHHNPKQQQQRTVPSLESHLPDLNVSTMTESLFPPPAKRHRRQDDHLGKQNLERRAHVSKKYSLDDLLNQAPPLHTTNQQGHSHAPVPMGHGPRLCEEGGRGMQQEGKGKSRAVGTRGNKESLFTIAKGGWQVPPLKKGAKGHAGYDFSSWAKELELSTSKQYRATEHVPGRERQGKVASSADDSTELVLQYASTAGLERGAGVPTSSSSPPSPHCPPPPLPPPPPLFQGPTHKLIPRDEPLQNFKEERFGSQFEKENLDLWGNRPKRRSQEAESSNTGITPWVSSVKTAASVLTENPLSKRNMPHVFAGPPVSTSVDFDKSIFGPLHHSRAKAGGTKSYNHHAPKKEDHASTTYTEYNESIFAPILAKKDEKEDPLFAKDRGRKPFYSGANTTQFNESVLAPIVAAKMLKEDQNEPLGGGTVSLKTSCANMNSSKRKRSTFELMMESLERSCRADALSSDANVPSKLCGQEEVKAPPPPATFVPSHVSHKCKEPCLPTSGDIPSLTASEGSEKKGKYSSTTSRGNVSVFHELMCLEEEISLHYEDNLLTQNSPMDIEDRGEDPIFPRPLADKRSVKVHPFDSSQDDSQPLEDAKIKLGVCLEGESCLDTSESSGDPSLLGRAADCSGISKPGPSSVSGGNCEFTTFGIAEGAEEKIIAEGTRSTSVEATQTDFQVAVQVDQFCNHGSVSNVPELPLTSTIATQTTEENSAVEPLLEQKSELVVNSQTSDARESVAAHEIKPQSNSAQEKISSEWSSITGENLTINLELCRTWKNCGNSEEKEAPATLPAASDSEVAKTIVQDTGISNTAASECSECYKSVPRDKESEMLREKIKELKEKLLSAESTAVWQSLVIRLLKLDRQES